MVDRDEDKEQREFGEQTRGRLQTECFRCAIAQHGRGPEVHAGRNAGCDYRARSTSERMPVKVSRLNGICEVRPFSLKRFHFEVLVM